MSAFPISIKVKSVTLNEILKCCDLTNNTKINHIMVSFSDHGNSDLIDRVHYKRKLWQFHGILIILFKISLFSHDMQKVTFPP